MSCFGVDGKDAFVCMRSIFLQPYRCPSRRRTDAGTHTPCRLCSETLLDDFLAKYVLWLWVPHRALLVRDDGRWSWFVVIASVAKQSMAHPRRSWIASLRSQ